MDVLSPLIKLMKYEMSRHKILLQPLSFGGTMDWGEFRAGSVVLTARI